MNIKGKHVTLRAVTIEDQQMIVDMFNNPEIEELVVGWAPPLSLEQQVAYFNSHLNKENAYRFVIETELDGSIGIAILSDLDWKNRSAGFGIKTRLDVRIKTVGAGIDAMMAMYRYAFDELGLHRINANRLADNQGSAMLARRCGITDEGIARSCIYKNGQWKDLVYAGILEDDYRELCRKNHYWDKAEKEKNGGPSEK